MWPTGGLFGVLGLAHVGETTWLTPLYKTPSFGRVYDDARVPSAPGRRPLGRRCGTCPSGPRPRPRPRPCPPQTPRMADVDGASPDSFCVWTPGGSVASSPARSSRKSGSTGSLSRWRRVNKLVIGRSYNDGRDKFHFLSAPPSPAREQPKGKPRGRDSKATTELDTVAASHRLFYGAKASPGTA